jgi:hypothetical protein
MQDLSGAEALICFGSVLYDGGKLQWPGKPAGRLDMNVQSPHS